MTTTKEQAKATPGPWTIDAPDPEGALAMVEGSMILANNAEEGRRLVAEVLSHDAAEGEERHDADARLIAASPDMLAALEYIVGWGPDWDAEKARDMAREAIAKARGTTHATTGDPR